MEMAAPICIVLTFLLYGLFSNRLGSSAFTPPMFFLLSGLLLGWPGVGLLELEPRGHNLKIMLEVTLALVLFSDAARIDLGKLRKSLAIPQRLLLRGMPLTLLLGTAVAITLPLGLTFCEAALLVAILTPTDAALGQVVVNSKQVPERIRIALNVESGINDGLALPIVLMFASIASALETHQNMQWFQFAVMQLVFGPLTGLVVGYVGARLLAVAKKRGFLTQPGEGIYAFAIAALCVVLAEAVHGNGFIAAFVGGLVFGHQLKNQCHYLFEFVETQGQILTLGTFFIFGALLMTTTIHQLTAWHWLFAIFSLTIMRMLPVMLSLRDLKLDLPTTLFLGWFGPRGLASLLFVLIVIIENVLPNADTFAATVFITVLLSILAHGISAAPLARLYGSSPSARLMEESSP